MAGASRGAACAVIVRRATAFERAKPRLVAVIVSLAPTLTALCNVATLAAESWNRSTDESRGANRKLPRAIVRSRALAIFEAPGRASLAFSIVCTRHCERPEEQVTRARGMVNAPVWLT